MKKLFFTFLTALFTTALFAQDYTFRKVIAKSELGSNVVKLKGKVKVTDSIISITTNGIESKMPVVLKQNVPPQKVFVVLQPDNSDYEIRITFSNTSFSKKETAFLLYEMKDNFRNTLTSAIYPLIPQE